MPNENEKSERSTPLYVLDSYAVLALLQDEPGSARVEALLQDAEQGTCQTNISLINVGELAYILERRYGSEQMQEVLVYLRSTALQWNAVNEERVLAASHLKAKHPISYADAFAASLALELNAILITGDPEFQYLEQIVQIEWLVAQVPPP